MTVTLALVLTLLVMVAVNVWVHVGPERWQPVTGPAVAVLLLLVGRWAGLSWSELGLGRAALLDGLLWGGAAVALVAAGFGVGVAVPASRRWFLDARHRVGPARAAGRALLVVPLGVVVLEEVAFRSVLWGLVEVGRGPLVAAAATSVLFGVWHVLPAIDGARANAHDGDGDSTGDTAADAARRAVVLRQVAGTVAFTTLAGIVFAVLRQQSGSLVAPFLLHWATNGLGILAAAWAWSTQRD
ncbi:MAG: CPBP family intramembrane glutamic endopeptidase [Ornithinibacter sp.]